MTPAEFEEAAYEAPLYNQLERGLANVYTPGRVLEHRLGFDRGILIAEHAVWETLGYSAPPPGIALGYYDWPMRVERRIAGANLPRYRLNIFLQAKRSVYYPRRPRSLSKFSDFSGPLWAFSITKHQQRLLEGLSRRSGKRAHVTYAAPAFHTNADLYRHTRLRSVVRHSTFPSVSAMESHEAWYYRGPGTRGVANPDPERVEEPPFPERLESLAADAPVDERGDIFGFENLAEIVLATAQSTEDTGDPQAARYLDDLQTLDRLIEPYALRPTFYAYAQVRLFTLQFDLTWLIHSGKG
jgi:hypothetical protein